MELAITNYNNFYKLKGVLNKESLELFNQTFRNVFDKCESLTLSIEDIEVIDRSGVKALASLHNLSLIKNKKLSIIGLGCKDLYEHFKSEETAA